MFRGVPLNCRAKPVLHQLAEPGTGVSIDEDGLQTHLSLRNCENPIVMQ